MNKILSYEQSFASHEKAKYWSKRNDIAPINVFLHSNKKYFFDCETCHHTFNCSACNAFNGQQCSYCYGDLLCGSIDCTICFEKSFASHQKSKFLSKKNPVDPSFLRKGSRAKYIFDCDKCEQEYTAVISSVTIGHWCACTINKTEIKLFEELSKYYPYLKRQFKIEWCKSKNNIFLPFDFVLEDKRIIIELDGYQHFTAVKHWNSHPEIQQQNDKYKMKCANDNGYSIIRIMQDDVFNDKYDWLTELRNNIESVKGITIIYMCKNDEYDPYL